MRFQCDDFEIRIERIPGISRREETTGCFCERNETVTSMLIGLLDSPQKEVLMNALPTLAVDGSLGFVTDFKKDPSLSGAAGKVHAKTGTYVGPGQNGMLVKGQGLGGYVKTRSGRTLAFHVTVNGVPISTIEDLTQIFQDQGTISALLWRDY